MSFQVVCRRLIRDFVLITMLSSVGSQRSISWEGPSADDLKDAPKRVTLVTFNIHHGEGADGKLDLDRIADVVADADLIALQEVDRHFDARSRFVDQAQYLAERLDRYWVYAANVDLAGGDGEGVSKSRVPRRQYGVALLSKFPITYSRNHLLPQRRRAKESSEQRGLLETQVRAPAGSFRVFVTHLTHDSREERLLQVARIREILAQAEQGGPPIAGVSLAPTWVMAGDFNFRPESEEYEQFLAEEPGAAGLAPVDAWAVLGKGTGATIGVETLRPSRIDYVWVSRDLRPRLLSVRVDERTRASDHQPLFVSWRLP